MDVNAVPYLNKQMFQIGNPVPVDISGLQLSLNLNPSTHSQSVETAHELMMGYLSQEGYTVIIRSDLVKGNNLNFKFDPENFGSFPL